MRRNQNSFIFPKFDEISEPQPLLITAGLKSKTQFDSGIKIFRLGQREMSVVPPEDVLKYMNEARTNPSGFAKYVKAEMDTFFNEWELPLKPGCNYRTNESKKVWKETYEFLTHQKPLKAYKLNPGLTLAADDHAIDMAQHNFFGHNSSNGQSFSKRIEKRCGQAFGSSGQNIGSDFKVAGRNHALQTVMGLIIDDGVPSRGHRKNIFSADFTNVGCSSRIQEDKIITVIDFHSADLPTINNSSNGSNAGSKIDYPPQKKGNGGLGGFGGQGGDDADGSFGGFGGKGGLMGQKFDDKGWNVMPKGHGSNNSSGRHVVNKSTSTKSQTMNGVKKTVKIVKIKYSDGTEEEEREQTIG